MGPNAQYYQRHTKNARNHTTVTRFENVIFGVMGDNFQHFLLVQMLLQTRELHNRRPWALLLSQVTGTTLEMWHLQFTTLEIRYVQFHLWVLSGHQQCETMCDWVNTLWPSDAIWRHRSGSTLAQVMACCLTAPSHYLDQCWLNNSAVHQHSSEGNFTRNT